MMSNRASWVFGVITAAGAGIVVVGAFFLAVLDHPFRAVILLGVGMITLGFLRAVWPGQPWFGARNRWSDGFVYVAVGAALVWLSPWTSAVPPG